MNKSESIKEIVSATIAVMKEVKGIDKTMTIGKGDSAYQGVSDKEVKKIIGDAMQNNGLAIFPIGVIENTKLTEWDETTSYGTKHKQSTFANVTTTYLLTHTSGEFMEVSGYGHGVDSQDKAAGKATTYALKYLLLYMFMVPTGKIDDADKTHSDDIPIPPAKVEVKPLPAMTEKALQSAIDRTRAGEEGIWEHAKKVLYITKEQEDKFISEIQKPINTTAQ